jgi:hypothetical protein
LPYLEFILQGLIYQINNKNRPNNSIISTLNC